MSDVNVTIYRFGGGEATTVKVPEGSTVAVAFAEAGVSPDGCNLRVDNQAASPETPLTGENQVVTAAPRIRGGV